MRKRAKWERFFEKERRTASGCGRKKEIHGICRIFWALNLFFFINYWSRIKFQTFKFFILCEESEENLRVINMFTVPGIEPPGWKVHLPSPLHLTDFSVRTGSFNLFGLRQPCRHWSSAAAQPIGSALPLVRREGSWNISRISWCAIGGWAASLLFHWFRIRNWGLKILNAVFLKKSQFTIFFFRNKPKSCITKNIYTVQLIIKKYEGGWGR